jgi:hypothetical protein
MPSADVIWGEEQDLCRGIPDRECPVTYQLRETLCAPTFVSSGSNLQIGTIAEGRIAKLAGQVFSIVESTIPGNESS